MFFTEGVCVALREEQSIEIKIKKNYICRKYVFSSILKILVWSEYKITVLLIYESLQILP